jgi:DNA-binding transcriptional MerR regulator
MVKHNLVDLRAALNVNGGMQPTGKRSYGCSELAKLCGVSADTIRHYDRKGLIMGTVRAANGYRRFPPTAPRRVTTVRAALAMGFSLQELRTVLRERDRGGSPCQRVRGLAEEKLERLEDEMKRLRALRNRLRGVLKDWDGALARTATGAQAHLLDRLIERSQAR